MDAPVAKRLQAVKHVRARQIEIIHEESVRVGPGRPGVKDGRAIAHDVHRAAKRAKRADADFPGTFIAFGEEGRVALTGWSGRGRMRLVGRPGCLSSRQVNGEGGAPPHLGVDGNGSSIALNDAAHDGES